MPQKLTSTGVRIGSMASMIEMDSNEWTLVEDLFDPPGRAGQPPEAGQEAGPVTFCDG